MFYFIFFCRTSDVKTCNFIVLQSKRKLALIFFYILLARPFADEIYILFCEGRGM